MSGSPCEFSTPFQAHERTLATDILFGLLKEAKNEGPVREDGWSEGNIMSLQMG